MATKLSGSGTTGLANVKGYRTRDSDMAVWSTVAAAFEAYNAANIASYGIAAAEQGATGIYSFTDPAETVSGRFRLIDAAGASLTVADVANRTFWEAEAGGVSPANANKIADHVRRRTQGNVEASSDGDLLDLASQYGLIQQCQESSVTGNTMTVRRTDGVTVLGTKSVSADPSANPIIAPYRLRPISSLHMGRPMARRLLGLAVYWLMLYLPIIFLQCLFNTPHPLSEYVL